MRKIFLFTLVIAFGFFALAGSGLAATYTIPIVDLADSNFVTQMGTESGRSQVVLVTTTYERYSYSGGGQVQTGDSFDWDSSAYNNNFGFDISSLPLASDGLGDLSGYTFYDLDFHNPNSFPIHVNTYFNTGDTDAGNTDRFYQNGWVWLDPGAYAHLSIDFSSADTYIGGSPVGSTAVLNQNEVSNIGFQVAVPGDAPGYDFGAGTCDFNVDVAPVPIPTSVLLLGSGLLGLIGVGRFRFRKKA